MYDIPLYIQGTAYVGITDESGVIPPHRYLEVVQKIKRFKVSKGQQRKQLRREVYDDPHVRYSRDNHASNNFYGLELRHGHHGHRVGVIYASKIADNNVKIYGQVDDEKMKQDVLSGKLGFFSIDYNKDVTLSGSRTTLDHVAILNDPYHETASISVRCSANEEQNALAHYEPSLLRYDHFCF
jgi:hypothetical protein